VFGFLIMHVFFYVQLKMWENIDHKRRGQQ